MDKLSHDIIYISVNSKVDKDGKIYIDRLELSEIINIYGNIVIVFINDYYNLHQFISNIKYSEIDIYGQGDKSQGFYIVIKKN